MLLADYYHEIYHPLRLRGRSQNTDRLYRSSIAAYSRSLGRAATLDDLDDILVARHLEALQNAGKSPATVEKERCQILAVWRHAHRRGLVSRWPDVPPAPVPLPIPLAWQQDELSRILAAADQTRGSYCGVPAGRWWVALILIIWDTAERIGAVMQARWEWYSPPWLLLPASTRKGGCQPRQFLLGSDTQSVLLKIREPERDLLFPHPWCRSDIFRRFGAILKRAGLPAGSRDKFHRLRRSAASWYEAAGGDATELLGHSNRKTTRRYLDPRVVRQPQPCELLFRIGQGVLARERRPTAAPAPSC